MKKQISFLGSFQAKVTLILIFSMLLIGITSNLLIHKFTIDSQFTQLRENLKIIAQTAASIVDADMLSSIPLERDGINTLSYQTIAVQLRSIKKKNPSIYYIYIMAKTPVDGIWQFVVDPDPLSSRRTGITSFPGDRYDASRFPEMLKAFNSATADKKIETDEWGAVLSAYAPIVDKDGKSIAVLGVDMMASDIYIAQKEIRSRTLLVLILGIILSFIFGMLFSRRITGPIDELVEGTRRISRGDLTYKVKARGVNEIRELAGSFNKMADALNDLQRKNHNYFYNVIQSLVRIVEAKDSYTRGHSERVAKYGMKIATRMGFPLDKIELVRETAMLHDIGKLGIQDSILNKEGGLTEEEWEIIRQHPILGEDILRPVSLNHEMLSIVRAHHERYDGNGYPDKLKGDEIGIFAQILSVADAYDAMTSARAYRSPFSRSEAMTELRKNKGAQFNGEIVDIFVEILTEEKN